MSFNDSNLVQFYNTYNLADTKKSAKAIVASSFDAARSTREIAQYARASFELDKMRAQVEVENLKTVIENNQQLKNISYELESIGYSIYEMANKISTGLGEVRSAIDNQTVLHKEHYDELKKEKVLKEVLYQMEKFQENCLKDNDNFQYGFGSKIIKSIIANHSFGTKDLNDIKDKEYFDKILKNAEKGWSSISDKQKDEIDNFEFMYFTYNELSEISSNLDERVNNIYPLQELEIPRNASIPKEPVLETLSKPQILEKNPLIIEKIGDVNNFFDNMKKVRIAFYITLGFCLLSFIVFIRSDHDVFKYMINKNNTKLYESIESKKVKKVLNVNTEIKVNNDNIENEDYVEISLSGEKGWVVAETITKTQIKKGSIFGFASLVIFTLSLLFVLPAIVIIRIIMRISFYEKFKIDKSKFKKSEKDIYEYNVMKKS